MSTPFTIQMDLGWCLYQAIRVNSLFHIPETLKQCVCFGAHPYSSFAVATVTLHFNRLERVKRSRFFPVAQYFYSSAEGSVSLYSLANKAVLLPTNVKYSIRQPGVGFSLIIFMQFAFSILHKIEFIGNKMTIKNKIQIKAKEMPPMMFFP